MQRTSASDEAIRQRVIDEMASAPVLKVSEIGVTVKSSIVTLMRTVATHHDVAAAQRVA